MPGHLHWCVEHVYQPRQRNRDRERAVADPQHEVEVNMEINGDRGNDDPQGL
jgi:hypothetical protein